MNPKRPYFPGGRKIKNRKILETLVFSLVIILFYFIFHSCIFSIFLAVCLFFVFLEISQSLREKKSRLVNNQLIEFLINMVVMLRAGKSVRNIIKDSGVWLKNPFKSYLKILSDELELNFTFDKAMDNFAQRCSSKESQLVATALKLNNKIGGDLVFIISNIIETLKESLKIKSNSRTLTLQSRYSGTIISLMPVAILILMFFSMNSALREFFSSRIGNIFLFSGSLLEISGIAVIRKMVNLDN